MTQSNDICSPGPPGIQFENALLQVSPVSKYKCPYVKDKNDIGFQLYTSGCTASGGRSVVLHGSRQHVVHWQDRRGLYRLSCIKVARITGLDPALPLFNKVSLDQRLDPSDAHFVDVIHTDAGIFGFNQLVGHVDFFPNGGASPQPGCELEVVIPQQQLLNKFFCSHWRSYMFFSESVLRPEAFIANQCHSWKDFTRGHCAGAAKAHMGYGVEKTARGTYFLLTHRQSPFSIE
ncbi:unnamed protein product [Leptidea sinapis]|uniref:Lipase domain-containing protein n=1 Tax=Leptidea sinapis TaxID=189913 RepID=A0A5E4QY22_9NEOP|nr:unnamed protein product [Leptidea sinapis]